MEIHIDQVKVGDVFKWGSKEYTCISASGNRCECKYNDGTGGDPWFGRFENTVVEILSREPEVKTTSELPNPPVYDYSLFHYGLTSKITAHINAHCADGWELISITPVRDDMAVLMMKY